MIRLWYDCDYRAHICYYSDNWETIWSWWK